MKTTRSIVAEGYQLSRSISLGMEVLLMTCLLVGIAASQSDGDIRLANTTKTGTGQLEIFLNRTWGTICFEDFNEGAAQAACTQLGHYSYQQFATVETLGIIEAPSSTRILLSSVKCLDNNEGHILRCDFSMSPSHDCTHKTDVALRCSGSLYDNPYDTQVRLRGGAYLSRGTLEVYLNNQWGTVCYDGFTTSAYDTACRQLGYTNYIDYGIRSDLIDVSWLTDKDFNCDRSYSCLRQCFKYPAKRVNCDRGEVVSLNCTFNISKKNSQTAGTESLCDGKGGLSAGGVAGVVITVLIIILVTLICVVSILCILHKKRRCCWAYEPIN